MSKSTTVEFRVMGCTQQSLPLPPRLSPYDAIREVRVLDSDCFPTKEGKRQYKRLKKDGWRLLSWPDGTRVGLRNDSALSDVPVAERVEFITRLYFSARDETERRLEAFLSAPGGTA